MCADIWTAGRFDEAEAHLHPRWQREILPAVLDLTSILAEEVDAQTDYLASRPKHITFSVTFECRVENTGLL